jgi:hypothetical protein
MTFSDFKEHGSEAAVKKAGKYVLKGKYEVVDGDIIFFKVRCLTYIYIYIYIYIYMTVESKEGLWGSRFVCARTSIHLTRFVLNCRPERARRGKTHLIISHNQSPHIQIICKLTRRTPSYLRIPRGAPGSLAARPQAGSEVGHRRWPRPRGPVASHLSVLIKS